MRYFFSSILLFQIFSANIGYSQNNFSLGGKLGFGCAVPSSKATFDVNGNSYPLRSNAYYSIGILGQYLLGGILGIETGLLVFDHKYSKRQSTISLNGFLGKGYFVKAHGAQIPIQLIYKINTRSNSSKNIKITAGVSMEWTYLDYNSLLTQVDNFYSTALMGIRIGNKKGKYGKIDYGLEYKCSFWKKYTLKGGKDSDYLIGRGDILSFNLYYFFLNREL